MNDRLNRSLDLKDSVFLVVGLILGVGIYQTPPLVAAALNSSTELIAFWILGAILSWIGAVCYLELATAFPEQGGDYFFLRLAFGRLVAFLYGWSQIFLIRPGAIAAVAFPFASYFKAGAPAVAGDLTDPVLASIAIIIFTAFNIFGTRMGVMAQNALSLLSYVVLFIIALGGLFTGSNGAESIAASTNSSPNYGLALILVLFTYGGWSELALVAGEVRNPTKTLVRAMFIGLGLIALIYCLVNFAYLNALGFGGLQSVQAPATHVFPILGTLFISMLISICCLTTLNAMILSSARISYAFGKDFYLFSRLGEWNREANSPVQSLLLQGVISVVLTLLAGSFSSILVYTTAVVWVFYLMVGLSVFILRVKSRHVERPYKVWGYPITPMIFCASSLYLVWSALKYDLTGSALTLGFVALGVPIYLLSKHRSSA